MNQERLSALNLIQVNARELVKLNMEKMIDWFDSCQSSELKDTSEISENEGDDYESELECSV